MSVHTPLPKEIETITPTDVIANEMNLTLPEVLEEVKESTMDLFGLKSKPNGALTTIEINPDNFTENLERAIRKRVYMLTHPEWEETMLAELETEAEEFTHAWIEIKKDGNQKSLSLLNAFYSLINIARMEFEPSEMERIPFLEMHQAVNGDQQTLREGIRKNISIANKLFMQNYPITFTQDNP